MPLTEDVPTSRPMSEVTGRILPVTPARRERTCAQDPVRVKLAAPSAVAPASRDGTPGRAPASRWLSRCEDDLEPPRSVHALHAVELDVRGRGRAGDEGHRSPAGADRLPEAPQRLRHGADD